MTITTALLLGAWTLLHVIISPWGMSGVVTYYPVKFMIGYNDTTYDGNLYLKYFIEFESAYLTGPLAVPILIVSTVATRVKQRRTRLKQERLEAYFTNAVKDISRDVIRITQMYAETSAKSAATDLVRELQAIISSHSDDKTYDTSMAAIAVLEDFANRTYRNDKKRLLWRIAESRHIVEDYRKRYCAKKEFLTSP